MMKNPNRIILMVLLAFYFINVKSQQSILLNQAAYNAFLLNPAASGIKNEVTANCHYKKNWMGFSESPELMQFTLDGPINNGKIGLGLNVLNEKAGIFSKSYLLLAVRYKLKITSKQHLFFGISGGLQRQASDFSKIKANSPEEFSQWPQQQAVTIPDAAFGLVYNFKRFYLSLSANQLLQQNYYYKEPVYNKELQYKTISHFVASIQNTFVLKSETWFYTPQLILRTPQGLPLQLDFLNTISYKTKVLIGMGYRYYYAVYGTLGFGFTDHIRLVYSYEYSQGIQTYTKGGHEIGLSFILSNKNSAAKSKEENLNKNAVDEIFEKLDKQDQQMEVMNRRLDSLDKSVSGIKKEMEELKNNQLKFDEITKDMEAYMTKNDSMNMALKTGLDSMRAGAEQGKSNAVKKNKYKAISPVKEEDFTKLKAEENASYKIVLGVYKQLSFAKAFQKILLREMDFETKLLQLEGHASKFIYVCTDKEYGTLAEALKDLKVVRKKLKSQTTEITNGEAWILQILKD